MPVTDFILVVYLLVPPACYFNKTRTPCQIIYKVYSMITSPDNYFVEHIFQWLLLVSKKNKFAKVGQSVYLKWHFIFLLIWNTELGIKKDLIFVSILKDEKPNLLKQISYETSYHPPYETSYHPPYAIAINKFKRMK